MPLFRFPGRPWRRAYHWNVVGWVTTPWAASESTAASNVAPRGMVTMTDGASGAGEAQPMTAIIAPTAAILLMPPSPAAHRDSAATTARRPTRPRPPCGRAWSRPARGRPGARGRWRAARPTARPGGRPAERCRRPGCSRQRRPALRRPRRPAGGRPRPPRRCGRPGARRVFAWGSASRRGGSAWREAAPASGTRPTAPIQCGARPSRRRAAVPPRRSSLLHRLEELGVVLRALHALEEEFDAFHRRHVGKEVAEQVDLVELLLGKEQLFLAGAGLLHVDRGERPPLGDAPVEDDFRVAGAL